jgi:hypothetical protein
MPTTEIYARLVEGGVELSRDPLVGAHRVSAPLTDPVIVDVQPRTGRVIVPRGSATYVRSEYPVRLRTIEGTTHTLLAASLDVKSGITFRFVLFADLNDVDKLEYFEAWGRSTHAAFLAGGAAPFAEAKQQIERIVGSSTCFRGPVGVRSHDARTRTRLPGVRIVRRLVSATSVDGAWTLR